jgi:hypothetical protein
MSMSPRELAIARLQRSIAPPSLRGTRKAPATPAAAPAAAPLVVTPAAPKEKEWYQQTWYKVFLGVSDIAAMGLSYQRNKSILWAIAHGFGPVGPAYLAYRGAQALSERKGGANLRALSRRELVERIEDGYGDQSTWSRAQAQAASDQIERREMDWGEWQSAQPQHRE